MLHSHVQVMGDDPRCSPGEPNVSTCNHPQQNACNHPHHPSGATTGCRRWGRVWGGLFHGEAGHVEDSFCRNRAVILNLS